MQACISPGTLILRDRLKWTKENSRMTYSVEGADPFFFFPGLPYFLGPWSSPRSLCRRMGPVEKCRRSRLCQSRGDHQEASGLRMSLPQSIGDSAALEELSVLLTCCWNGAALRLPFGTSSRKTSLGLWPDSGKKLPDLAVSLSPELGEAPLLTAKKENLAGQPCSWENNAHRKGMWRGGASAAPGTLCPCGQVISSEF